MTLLFSMNLGFAWGVNTAIAFTHIYYRMGLGFAYT